MSTKRITRTALGVALFVVFSLMLQVPVYQNYYISLGYFVIAVYLYSFGVGDGTIVGFLGVILYCLITGGTRGMPGWSLGNIVIGIGLGPVLQFNRAMWNNDKYQNNKSLIIALDIIAIVMAVVIGITLVKSFTEVILYAQPMTARMVTNLPATIADIITLIAAVPVAIFVDNILQKQLPGLAKAR